MLYPFISNKVSVSVTRRFCEIGLLIVAVNDANDDHLSCRILLLVLRDAERVRRSASAPRVHTYRMRLD